MSSFYTKFCKFFRVKIIQLHKVFYTLRIGNLIGIGLIIIQDIWKPIKLDAEKYYLSYAPVDISITSILLLNIVYYISIIGFLIIPTFVVQSIQPVKALKFK